MTRVLIGLAVVGGALIVLVLALGAPGSHGDIRWMMPARAFSVPSESMEPTFNVGDHFIAFRNWGGKYSRGDVIVFRVGKRDIWFKRVAGLPGDTVQMVDGVVVLNGKPVTQSRAGAGPQSYDGGPTSKLAEQFPGESNAHRILDVGKMPADDTELFRVPAGHLFVLGDNRDNSADSRFAHMGGFVGDNFVALDDIYGIVRRSAPK